MISFTNIDDLNKELRNVLIEQSELNSERVLNSLSLYGADLDKLFEDEIYVAIEQGDSMLLFELASDESNSNVSMEERDIIKGKLVCSSEINAGNTPVSNESVSVSDIITTYQMFRLKCIIYGDKSTDVALKLIGRLRTEDVKVNLYDKGIYISKVSSTETHTEFINNSMWLRNDFYINLGIKYDTQKINPDDNYKQLSELNIKEN